MKTFKVFAPNPTRAVSNIACSSARGQTSHCLHTTTKLTWKVSCRLAIQLLLAQLVSISKAKHSPVHLEHSILLLALMTSPLGRSHHCRSVHPSQTSTLNKFRYWKPNSCWLLVDVVIWFAEKNIQLYFMYWVYCIKTDKSASSTSGQRCCLPFG